MSLKIALFEDDKDLADTLRDLMEVNGFQLETFYKIDDPAWRSVDAVVGDFRNKLVSFSLLKKECDAEGIPLVAISGAETGYDPQLLKPFDTEDLKNAIFRSMVRAKELGLVRKKPGADSLIASLSSWLKG